jgi:excisionase family DNA binding protein
MKVVDQAAEMIDRQRQRPLTVKQTAELMGLSEYTVRAWIAARKLGYVRLGRAIRILPSEIERILQAGCVPSKQSRQDTNR